MPRGLSSCPGDHKGERGHPVIGRREKEATVQPKALPAPPTHLPASPPNTSLQLPDPAYQGQVAAGDAGEVMMFHVVAHVMK